MSSNAEFENLARELRALRASAPLDGDARSRETMLVMRLVHGLSKQRWQEFCHQFPLSQWCALPVPEAMTTACVADLRPDVQSPPPADMPPTSLASALSTELFANQLTRELLRLNRNGGDLSLLTVGVVPPHDTADEAGVQTQALVACLRHCLEGCDSLGVLAQGRLAAILPGVGQLKARRLAERLQLAFWGSCTDKAAQAEGAAGCAVGIVCVSRGGDCDAARLLAKAQSALGSAQAQAPGHIHLEISSPLDERTTLVHSHEKRFLFFGGDQS